MTGPKTNERPGTRAVHRYCGMSASKARQVLDLIRGTDVQRAAEILNGTEREAAEVIGKVLSSAVANAAHNDQQNPEELYVSACFADEGATMRRWRPRSRSSHAHPQAHVPHHHRREPAAGRPAGVAPGADGGGERQPFPPGRRLSPAAPTSRADCRGVVPPRPRLPRRPPLRRRRKRRRKRKRPLRHRATPPQPTSPAMRRLPRRTWSIRSRRMLTRRRVPTSSTRTARTRPPRPRRRASRWARR